MSFLKTFEDLHRLVYEIKQRENVLLDYKSGDNPKDADGLDIAKDVSSFADQSGGYLVYGVRADDNGHPIEINGVSDPEKLRDKIIKSAASITNLNPPIFVDPLILEGEVGGKKAFVVVTPIEESRSGPHFYRGTTIFWVRGADHNNPVEGSPEVMQLLQNRRAKLEDKRLAQLTESDQLALQWKARAYDPHHRQADYSEIKVPDFSISLLPKIFNETFSDVRRIREAIKNAVEICHKNYKWPSDYYYSFFEHSRLESYALTFVSRWYANTPQEKAAPNTIWTSASATGFLFHFEDIPLKWEMRSEGGAVKPHSAFNPIDVLRKILAFLLFAKEYYSILERSTSLDLRIQCRGTRGMAPLYNEGPLNGRRIIENHFVISRAFTTLELDQKALEQLVINSIAPELLIDINYEPDHPFDANEANAVKAVLQGR